MQTKLRRSFGACVLAGVTLAALAPSAEAVTPAPEAAAIDPLPSKGFGVRFGPKPATIAEYEAWLGRGVSAVTVFFHGNNDTDLLFAARGLINRFKGSKYRTLIFSMPLVVGNRNLASVASGSMDSLARELATALVAGGRADDVVRLGWEFNGTWFKWSAVPNPSQYASAFRRIVTVMRAVPGAKNLRFEWNVSRGGSKVSPLAYPGDAYVDIIGLDMYDRTYDARMRDPLVRWNSYLNDPNSGMLFVRDFARAHRKPMGISEWGLSSKHVPGVNPDNTLFIQKMVEFVRANNLSYANYFEDDSNYRHRLMLHYPQSAALYKRLLAQ